LLLVPAAPIAHGADVISNGPVSTVKGSDAINPRPGTQGSGAQFNSLFYVMPGEGEAGEPGRPSQHQLPDQPFFIAYENSARPVQSSDWWTGVGLQWYVSKIDQGWAGSYNDGVIRTQAFLSEPFYYQFVDFDGRTTVPIRRFHRHKVSGFGTRTRSQSRPTARILNTQIIRSMPGLTLLIAHSSRPKSRQW
jgi:hypothetical protein